MTSPPRPILTVAEMAAAELAIIGTGVAGETLMARAGAAVAKTAGRWPDLPIRVLCGAGNNGGDGYVAAGLLAADGRIVHLEALSPPATPACRAAAGTWAGDVLPFAAEQNPDELVIDALFGIGLSRPLDEAVAARALAVRRAGCPVIAVDLPSGLSGDLSEPPGEAFHATVTVTFHAKKPAHVLEPGRGFCGEVVVADIGLTPAAAQLHENGPSSWAGRLRWPTAASHKHARGRLAVVSGPAANTGAARLAARAGLRIGAGLVTVLTPPSALAVNAAHLEAVMLRTFDGAGDLAAAAERADAVVVGPAGGIGAAMVAQVGALARTGAALVVDADALTSFKDDPRGLFALLDRDDVLTPHAGEFERVFPGLLRSSRQKIAAVRAAADRAGCVVLLKGADTVIAAPDGRVAVNTNGSPFLATAGSGDVLAGMIGGLIAQGLDSFDAACAAVWIHAEAGADFGPGLIAEDLPGLLPMVLSRLYGSKFNI